MHGELARSVLVVDERHSVRSDLADFLAKDGYRVRTAETCELGRQMAQLGAFDFAVVNLELGQGTGCSGIDAAKVIARLRPSIRMVMLSLSPIDDGVAARLSRELPEPLAYVWAANPREGSNYIDEVRAQLRRLGEHASKEKCFVIMPFSTSVTCTEPQWSDIFKNLIKPGVESTGRYECYRSGPLAGNIITQIFDSLNSAEVVVADLTDRNANVFYELGVRHALRDATVLIAQRIDDVPFDLRPNATIVYDPTTEDGRQALKADLASAMALIEKQFKAGKRDVIVSPVRSYMLPPLRSHV